MNLAQLQVRVHQFLVYLKVMKFICLRRYFGGMYYKIIVFAFLVKKITDLILNLGH